MTFQNTPLGVVQLPKWAVDEMASLTDYELLDRACKQLGDSNLRPITYTMVVTRKLWNRLQDRLNR